MSPHIINNTFNFSVQNLPPSQKNSVYSDEYEYLANTFSALNGMPLDPTPNSTHYAIVLASEIDGVLWFWNDYFNDTDPSISDIRHMAKIAFHEPTSDAFILETYFADVIL